MAWSEGQKFGRFTLGRELGAGAFAEVWLAVETSGLGFRKEVALKLLRTTDPDKIESLQQEARLVASLRHPNIVDVLAVEEIEGTWTVVMEYVDGGTLEDLIERLQRAGVRMPDSVIVRLGLDIARALDRAHTASDDDGPTCILHRDLKPANILVDRTGVAKLTDFGVAKVVGAAAATATGAAKGTPAYIAPESWAGSRDFAPPVDLFGLGCILYELVTVERLFGGDAVATIFWQMLNRAPADEVAPVRELMPALAPVVEKLLARDPAERYQAAADVEADLVQIEAALEVTADYGQFLDLLSRAEAEGGAATETGTARTLPSGEHAWSDLLAKATGEVSSDEPPKPPPEALESPRTPSAGARTGGAGGSKGTTRKRRRSTGVNQKPARRRPPPPEPADDESGFSVPRGLILSIWALTGVVVLALVGVLALRALGPDPGAPPASPPDAPSPVAAAPPTTPPPPPPPRPPPPPPPGRRPRPRARRPPWSARRRPPQTPSPRRRSRPPRRPSP